MAQFNIGTQAVEAVKELRGSVHFTRLMAALGQIAQTRVLAALEAPVDARVDQTAHARALYDLWASIEAVRSDVHPSQVRPGELPILSTPPQNGAERARGARG